MQNYMEQFMEPEPQHSPVGPERETEAGIEETDHVQEDGMPSWIDSIVTPKEAVLAAFAIADKPMRVPDVDKMVQEADWLSDTVKASLAGKSSGYLYTVVNSLLEDYQDLIEKISRGVYVKHPEYDGEPLSEQTRIERSPRRKTVDKEAPDEDADDAVVPCFGISWDRELVDWGRTGGELLGSLYDGDDAVDFAEQVGVYVLYDMRGNVVYIGRTTEGNLYGRLKAHTVNSRRSSRWTHFSWFGLFPVKDDFTLSEHRRALSRNEEVILLESVLIELLTPAFNDKGGDRVGGMYEQVESRSLATARMNSMVKEIDAHRFRQQQKLYG